MKKTFKHMFRSAVVCFICVMLLTSSTYAWYTENPNREKGPEDAAHVEMFWSESYHADTWNSLSNGMNQETSKLFTVEDGLWEPGRTEVRYIELVLRNSSAMAYSISVDPAAIVSKGDPNLAQAIDVYFVPNVTRELNRADLNQMTRVCSLAELCVGDQGTAKIQGSLIEDVPAKTALILHMDESVGNKYNIRDLSYEFNMTFEVTQQ